MSTATLVSTSEYLATSYRPDRELIDGELVERNWGEFDHSKLQTWLAIWMGVREREWNVHVLVEQRIQVSASRFRIPDVCVISRDQVKEAIISRPPLVCIEVLSKDDTLRSLQGRIDDYLAFGVPNIWILDSETRSAYICTRGSLRTPEDGVLQVDKSPIRIELADFFAQWD